MAPQDSSGLVWEHAWGQQSPSTAAPAVSPDRAPVKSAPVPAPAPSSKTPAAQPPTQAAETPGVKWEPAWSAAVPATAGQTKGSWLTTPLLSPTTLMGGEKNVQAAQAMVTKQENLAHPVRAALLGGLVGASQSSADILSAITAPANIALEVVSRFAPILQARGIRVLPSALRLGQTGAAAGFGVAAGKQALESGVGPGDVLRAVDYPLGLTGPPKATPKQIEQQLLNWSAMVGGIGGTATDAKDALHRSLRNKTGMNDDLASEVADRIVKKRTAEAETAQRTREVQAGQAQQVTAIEQQLGQDLQNLEGHRSARVSDLTRQVDQAINQSTARIPQLQKQVTLETSRVLADTTQTMLQKNAEFRLRFGNLDEKLTDPISTPAEINGIVRQAFADKGVAEAEIPAAATRALRTTQETTSVRAPTSAELRGAQLAQELEQKNTPPAQIKSALVNLGFVPEQVKTILNMQQGVSAVPGRVASRMVTRVRNDLWDSAATAKDGAVASALYDAYEKLTDVQEKAFEKAGMGAEYRTVKRDYAQFKRGIGSPMMYKLVAAYDAEAQSITPKLAMMTDSTKAQAVRGVLKSAGIDTGPLDSVLEQLSAAEKAPAQARREQIAGTREATKAAGKTTGEYRTRAAAQIREARAGAQREIGAVRAAGKEAVAAAEGKPIVPGKTAEELEGLSNQEVLRMKLQEQADHMRSAGIGAPYAFFNIIYGLSQLARGSPFGLMHLGRGIASMQVPELMRRPDFQDWILRESEVEPSNKLLVAKIRQSLANIWYPRARRLATSGELAGIPYVAGQADPRNSDLVPSQ